MGVVVVHCCSRSRSNCRACRQLVDVFFVVVGLSGIVFINFLWPEPRRVTSHAGGHRLVVWLIFDDEWGLVRGYLEEAAKFFTSKLGSQTLRVAENNADIVTMVAPSFLGFKHVGINLRVVKPAGSWQHVLSGYMGGLLALQTHQFVANHYVGV